LGNPKGDQQLTDPNGFPKGGSHKGVAKWWSSTGGPPRRMPEGRLQKGPARGCPTIRVPKLGSPKWVRQCGSSKRGPSSGAQWVSHKVFLQGGPTMQSRKWVRNGCFTKGCPPRGSPKGVSTRGASNVDPERGSPRGSPNRDSPMRFLQRGIFGRSNTSVPSRGALLQRPPIVVSKAFPATVFPRGVRKRVPHRVPTNSPTRGRQNVFRPVGPTERFRPLGRRWAVIGVHQMGFRMAVPEELCPKWVTEGVQRQGSTRGVTQWESHKVGLRVVSPKKGFPSGTHNCLPRDSSKGGPNGLPSGGFPNGVP
jgi:hypothetical protein